MCSCVFQGDGPLKRTHVDAYNGYAVIRCPTQFISMAVLQGQFAKGSKNKGTCGLTIVNTRLSHT